MASSRARRIALLVLAAAVAIPLASAALAGTAGKPGRWTVVARGAAVPGSSASELGLARTRDGALHVAWRETGSTDAIRHRAVSPAGGLSPATTIVSGWSSLGDPELVVDGSGAVRAFFGGRRSTSPSDPLAGLLTSAAPPAGTPWSAPVVVHDRNQVGGARTASATVTADGTPFEAWYGVSEIWLHRGLGAGEPDRLFSAGAALTEFGPTVVDDAAGRLWVAWCGFGQGGGGVFVQQADPATGGAVGVPARLPGSTTASGGTPISTCNLERSVARRTPMVARAGGGVFVAGAAGYPTLSRVLVWRIDPAGKVPGGSFVVGSDRSFGHSTPVLAAAPDGRVWVAWVERRTGGAVVAARRSNRLGTVWGAPVRARAPRGWLLDALNVSAQAGRLDVLGLMSTAARDNSIQHTQLLPGLSLARGRTTRAGGRVTIRFRVLDAGDPVAGARVTLSGGRGTAVTGRTGVAAFRNPRRGSIRATATKAGYVGATARVRCC